MKLQKGLYLLGGQSILFDPATLDKKEDMMGLANKDAILNLATIGLIGIMILGSITSKPEVYDDVENYTKYMSFDAQNADSKWNKWGMDETIWPGEIDDLSAVVNYRMVYYNPWDAQYLGYLVMEYTPKDYAAELPA